MTKRTSPLSHLSTIYSSAALKLLIVARSLLLGTACSLMCQQVLELEALFEDHGVCSGVITDSLALERVLALAQPLLSASQRVNRQNEVHFLLELAAACAFPLHTGRFTRQVPDLTQWSGSDSDVMSLMRSLAAAVYMFIKLHLSPQQKYPRTPTEQLAAFAALLTRQQPGDVSVLHNAFSIQRAAHIEFKMLEQLGHELATLTPMAWVDIFRQRFTLKQQQWLQSGSKQQSLLVSSPSLLIRLPQPTVQEFQLSHFHSQPSRRCSLVRFSALVVAARLVLRPAVSPDLVAPTFYFRPCAVTPLCARVTLHQSRS